jgi:beta-galactosidase
MTNAIESWSWREGEEVFVEVYARAAKAELFANGRSIGSKRFKKDCKAVFRVFYESGEISVAAYDEQGNLTGSSSLVTADAETVITIKPEQAARQKEGLIFALIQYTDANGILKPMEKRKISVSVSGGQLLAFGSACPYTQDDFHSGSATTYYGEALAIVRAGESGASITATDGKLSATADLKAAHED